MDLKRAYDSSSGKTTLKVIGTKKSDRQTDVRIWDSCSIQRSASITLYQGESSLSVTVDRQEAWKLSTTEKRIDLLLTLEFSKASVPAYTGCYMSNRTPSISPYENSWSWRCFLPFGQSLGYRCTGAGSALSALQDTWMHLYLQAYQSMNYLTRVQELW